MRYLLLLTAITLMTGLSAGATPDNVSIELTLDSDQAHIDGASVASDTTRTSFDYPYIVSDQPLGIVSYSEALAVEYSSGSPDSFKITQRGGTFLIPFTSGGYESIEDEEQDVSNRNLLANIKPSFNFFEPSTPVVNVIYVFEHAISSFEGDRTDIDELSIRNTINNKNYTELKLRND
jgi:hypothetical protein